MPSRFRRPRFRPRRRRLRRFRRKLRITNLWPAQKIVKFRLSNTAAYTGTAGAIGTNYWKANSLADPTGAATTQLPLGVDQLAALYTKYKILGSRITLIAHPETITGAAFVGLCLHNSTTPPATDLDHYRELPRTVMRMVSPDIDVTKLSMKYSYKGYPHHIKQIKDDDQQEGGFSTTPTDPTDVSPYFHIWVQDANKTQNVTFEIQAVIEYIVLLYEPVAPSRSAL